jgi:hypothetical protein
LLIDVAEAEAKCDQRNRGYPEGPAGPIQKHGSTREVKTGTYPLTWSGQNILVRLVVVIEKL